jgi:uncharacterized protein YndB with AHSA1/START domain
VAGYVATAEIEIDASPSRVWTASPIVSGSANTWLTSVPVREGERPENCHTVVYEIEERAGKTPRFTFPGQQSQPKAAQHSSKDVADAHKLERTRRAGEAVIE